MRKITSLILMLIVFVSTAMADLTQHYYKNRNFWQNAESYPAALNEVIDGATVRGEGKQTIKKDGATVQLASNPVTVTANGNVVVNFIHDGGDHMLNILGVDLVDAEGNVVASDYHYGSAGGTLYLSEYTLEGLTANAALTLRSFVYDNTATNDRTNSAAGRYEVTNVTGSEIVTVNAAVNLANGVYVIRDARSLDLPFYNGSVVARGSKIGDVADAVYTFTITKGNNGYYTIQVANGDYVVYTSTNGGGNVAVKAAADANDGNKWWAIREGNHDNAQRIIVPMTNDKYNAPGWNFSAGLNGAANKALGLWETNDGGSQWYIGQAPFLAEGTAKLKVANIYAYSNGTNIVKATTEGNSPLFTFTKGENGCYTIQDVNGKYLVHTTTNNHLLTLSNEATDDNKWWAVTADLQGKDGKLEILPTTNFGADTNAFNWAQNVTGANTALGFWYANDGNSYCELEMVPTEGLYCIKAAGTGNDASWYISYNNNEGLFAASLAAGERVGAKHIWNFEAVEGENGFKLKSCNLDKYATLENASSNGGSASKFEEEFDPATMFVFNPQGGNKFIIKDGNDNVVRTENGGAVNYWSGEVNETWQLVRVDEIEVSVNEFASLYLPFAVEVEGATAYAVEETKKDYVLLAEKAGIPANEGAILAGSGVATLKIVGEIDEDWSANKLEGTTVDTMIEAEAYVLGKVDGKIGLYTALMTEGTWKNNANKAYLPKAPGMKSASLRFGFGTTAIEEVETENAEAEVIYDLCGRRVNQITKAGVYIIGGRKVLVK